ncbi:TauD/TfdA family dioxygenase [Thalassobaculum sp.]|uniref:TauD/TfdA dioxygenase family protein n=1 Tax=Thalassobaculum sp. TaxID=2022740 RepID=UPI0032EAF9E9
MLTAEPLSRVLGAEIRGLDLSRPIADADREQLLSLFWEHKVIVVRGQEVAPDGFIRFAEAFGTIEPFFISAYNLPTHPQIYVLSNVRQDGKPIGRDGAGTHWHSDSTFTEKPSSATLLHGVTVPDRGGDTLFVNTVDAYERLDDETKARIQGRRAIHRYQRKEFVYSGDRTIDESERKEIERVKALRMAEAAADAASPTAQRSNREPDRLHPIVRTHPVTGAKGLYLNDEMTVGIEGIPDEEAVPLLRRLCEVATAPETVLRFKWQQGDVVVWDNAAVIHSATFTPPDLPRVMHRLTIAGTVPF